MSAEKWKTQAASSSATDVDFVTTTPAESTLKSRGDYQTRPLLITQPLGVVVIYEFHDSDVEAISREEPSQNYSKISAWLSELKHVRQDLIDLPEIIRTTSMPADPVENVTLSEANRFITRFFNVMIRYQQPYVPPHVSTEGKGEVSFEWWRNDKMLTFFVEPDGEITCLKVWGVNIWEEMEETSNPTDDELIDLWRWLNI